MKKIYTFPVLLILAFCLVACIGGNRTHFPPTTGTITLGNDGRTTFPRMLNNGAVNTVEAVDANVITNETLAAPSAPKDFKSYKASKAGNTVKSNSAKVAKLKKARAAKSRALARKKDRRKNRSKAKSDYVTRAEFEARVGDLEDATMDQWQMIIRLKYPNVKYLSIIHFGPGKTTLENFDAKMTAELKKIADKKYSIFEIWGSSDRTGSAKRNKILAEKRANYVAGVINDLQPGTVTSDQVKILGENVVAGKKKHNRTVIILCQ